MLFSRSRLRSITPSLPQLLWFVLVSFILSPLDTTRAQEVKPLRIIPTQLSADSISSESPFIAYSPNGRLLAASWKGGIRIFKASSGAPVATIPVREHVLRIGFSPDSKMIYGEVWPDFGPQLKNEGFPVVFWKLSNGKMVKTIQLKDDSLFALHPEGDRYAVAYENKVSMFDFKTQRLLKEYTLTEKQGIAWGLVFRPDGKALAISTEQGIQLLDVATMAHLHEALGREIAGAQRMKYSAEGRLLASLQRQYKLAVVKIEDSKYEIKVVRHETVEVEFWALAVSPNGGLIALGGGKNRRPDKPAVPYLELINTATGESVAQLHDQVPDDVHEIAFSPDGKQLAVTCASELAIRVFDTSQFVTKKKASKPSPKKSKPPKSDPIEEQPATRTWTSANGKFKIEAVLLEQKGSSVQLRKANGKVLSVDKDKLCPADNDYLKEH